MAEVIPFPCLRSAVARPALWVRSVFFVASLGGASACAWLAWVHSYQSAWLGFVLFVILGRYGVGRRIEVCSDGVRVYGLLGSSVLPMETLDEITLVRMPEEGFYDQSHICLRWRNGLESILLPLSWEGVEQVIAALEQKSHLQRL